VPSSLQGFFDALWDGWFFPRRTNSERNCLGGPAAGRRQQRLNLRPNWGGVRRDRRDPGLWLSHNGPVLPHHLPI